MKIFTVFFLSFTLFGSRTFASHDVLFGNDNSRRVIYRDHYFISGEPNNITSQEFDIKVKEPIYGIKFKQTMDTQSNIILVGGALNKTQVRIKFESRVAGKDVAIIVDVYGGFINGAVTIRASIMLLLFTFIFWNLG